MFITAYVGKFGYLGNGSYIYPVLMIKIKVMTQAIMFPHAELEEIVYQLQSKGAIVDPCVVDDLITCIKAHKQFEFSYIYV